MRREPRFIAHYAPSGARALMRVFAQRDAAVCDASAMRRQPQEPRTPLKADYFHFFIMPFSFSFSLPLPIIIAASSALMPLPHCRLRATLMPLFSLRRRCRHFHAMPLPPAIFFRRFRHLLLLYAAAAAIISARLFFAIFAIAAAFAMMPLMLFQPLCYVAVIAFAEMLSAALTLADC